VIKLLNTTVHVESRKRFCSARNTSATPASPECVAIKMCSMYLFGRHGQLSSGGSGCGKNRTLTSEGRPVDMKVSKAMQGMLRSPFDCLLTLILVAPFTDFSNELAISAPGNAGRLATGYGQDRESCPLSCRFEQFVSRIRQLVGWVNPRSRIVVGEAVYVAVPSFRGVGSLSLSPWSWTISRNDAERSYYDHRAPLELNTGAMITDCGTWHPLHRA
jgi:hypothetical protein